MRVFETVFDWKQKGYLQSGRLWSWEVVDIRDLTVWHALIFSRNNLLVFHVFEKKYWWRQGRLVPWCFLYSMLYP